jgi:hypothetical protein
MPDKLPPSPAEPDSGGLRLAHARASGAAVATFSVRGRLGRAIKDISRTGRRRYNWNPLEYWPRMSLSAQAYGLSRNIRRQRVCARPLGLTLTHLCKAMNDLDRCLVELLLGRAAEVRLSHGANMNTPLVS